jgi:hypothetical protein
MKFNKRNKMYIVLETHGGAEYAIVVQNEEGENKVFLSYELACKEAANCQNGIVVEV